MSPFPSRPGEGLPALGVLLLLGCAVYVASLVDVTLTGSLGWGLGVILVVGSLAAAARLARRDLVFAVVAPPLAFAVGTAAVVPYTAAAREASFPLGWALAFAGALGGGAPLLATAVVLSGGVAGVRWQLERRGHRRLALAGETAGHDAEVSLSDNPRRVVEVPERGTSDADPKAPQTA